MKGLHRKALLLLLTLLMVLGAVSVANATDSGASAGGDYTMPTQMEDNAQAGEKEEPETKTQADKPGAEATEKPDSGTNSEKAALSVKGTKAPTPTKATIKVAKTMSGSRNPKWLESDSFSFTLKAIDPTNAPGNGLQLVLTKKNESGNELKGEFEVTYNAEGTYIYSVTENDSAVTGVSNDPNTYYVRVKVYTTTGGGELVSHVEYFYDNTTVPDTTTPGTTTPNMTFANT